MEATIKTENKTLFKALIQILKKLNITVETEEKKISLSQILPRRKYPLKGSVLKYPNPFDSATNINEWDACK